MLAFTFRARPRGPAVLVLVLERENMARMTTGDPLDLRLAAMANTSPQAAEVLACRAADLDIVIAYEDAAGIGTIKDLAAKDDMAALIRYIERGRTVYDGEPANPRVIHNAG